MTKRPSTTTHTTQLSDAPPSPSQQWLVHQLYSAVMDNSLWPEIVLEVLNHIRDSDVGEQAELPNEQLNDLMQHFERAFQLSEHIVGLQEESATLGSVLDSLAVGVMLYDHNDQLVYSNRFSQEKALAPPSGGQAGDQVAVVPAESLKTFPLPKHIAKLVLHVPREPEPVLKHMQQHYYLAPAESHFLSAFYQVRNVKVAAKLQGLTYETARTYLRRIFTKTGVKDQQALLDLITLNPLALLKANHDAKTTINVRKKMVLADGRNLEYFCLGPESGQLILHFDALTGVTLDLLGNPERYLPTLQRLNLRLVTPCRPGTFRSDFKHLSGLSEWNDDLIALCDHLGAQKVVLLSQAFGSSPALAFAAGVPQRVSHAILCAPSYPDCHPANWRKMDVFYLINVMLSQHSPRLAEIIVPFLMRSVIQNTEKYLARHINRSRCQADIDVLSNPLLQKRIPAMLTERTTLGTQGLTQENCLNARWDFSLDDVSCPVHILQGEKDNVADPQCSMSLAQKLPEGKITLLNDLGQYLLFSEWPWVLELCNGEFPLELQPT